jgi:hypothetical protein
MKRGRQQKLQWTKNQISKIMSKNDLTKEVETDFAIGARILDGLTIFGWL